VTHKIFVESSDGFLNLRWNYSPLKEKAVPLPGGLFVCDECHIPALQLARKVEILADVPKSG
jgi:hypothetical protein